MVSLILLGRHRPVSPAGTPPWIAVRPETAATVAKSVATSALAGSFWDGFPRAATRLKQHIGTPPIWRRKNSSR
jgi:hypothetical protein